MPQQRTGRDRHFDWTILWIFGTALSVLALLIGWALSFWLGSPRSYAWAMALEGAYFGYTIGGAGTYVVHRGTRSHDETRFVGRTIVLMLLCGMICYIAIAITGGWAVVPTAFAIVGVFEIIAMVFFKSYGCGSFG